VENLEYKRNEPPKLDTVMLLGAGASRPAGIPTINEMTAEFLEEFPKNRIKKRVLPYMNTLKKITKFQFEKVDLETIMSVLVRLEDKKYKELLESKFPQVKKMEIPFSEHVKQSIQEFIRNKCENLRGVDYLWPLRAFFTDNTPLKIFTLNYDGTIEFHCEKEGIKYSDGFNPYWDPESFSSKLDVHLYKLHGSLYWFKGKTSHAIKVPIKGLDARNLRYLTDEEVSELMIYPEIEKNKESGIYSHISQQFKNTLLKTDVCMIIGYSFRDHDITETINESLLVNSDLWLILVSPHASKNKENFFPDNDEVKSRIITLDMGVKEALSDRILYSTISTLTTTRSNEKKAQTAQSKNQERLDYEYWTMIIRDYLKLQHDDRIKLLVERLSNIKFTKIFADYPNVIEMILCGRSLRYLLEYKQQKNKEKIKIWKEVFLGSCAMTEYLFFKEGRNEKLQNANPVKQKDLPWWHEDRYSSNAENIIESLKNELVDLQDEEFPSKLKKSIEKLKKTVEILTHREKLSSGGFKPITPEEILSYYNQHNLGILKCAKAITNSL